ncbi:MAG: hypothetical protein AAF213_07830 [Pseudomonadota bacterium]
MSLDVSIETVLPIAQPDFLSWLTRNSDQCIKGQWFISPPTVGRTLGLGWAQALQDQLAAYGKDWRLLADCGGHAGDAATAIGLGLPGILFTGINLDKTRLPAIAQRLSSMAEHRGVVFITDPPPTLSTA